MSDHMDLASVGILKLDLDLEIHETFISNRPIKLLRYCYEQPQSLVKQLVLVCNQATSSPDGSWVSCIDRYYSTRFLYLFYCFTLEDENQNDDLSKHLCDVFENEKANLQNQIVNAERILSPSNELH